MCVCVCVCVFVCEKERQREIERGRETETRQTERETHTERSCIMSARARTSPSACVPGEGKFFVSTYSLECERVCERGRALARERDIQ